MRSTETILARGDPFNEVEGWGCSPDGGTTLIGDGGTSNIGDGGTVL